jgi:EAL domain-containing protein (putative c-di-GMP-specific phosphodiesterase class I)
VISTELGITMGYICEEENPLEKASLALSHAKKRRKLFVQYSENLNLIEAGEQDFNTIKLIKDAIKDGEVIPHFQLIQNKNGQKKYETLMRIEHNGQVILPSQFLDVAKKSGDYEQLTRIMVDKSFKYFANRKEEFSVNLSYDDISDQEMLLYLHEKIEEYGVAKRVIFEIVESENIEDFTIVKEFISDMQKLGVKIAIDDFGSGYTNYSYLLQLKPDFLKIDGSIIKNIDTCEDSYIITQSIVDFANKLGIETVAEYIHSEEIYKLTKELNIDNFQGFFLNKPSSKV